MIDSLTVDYRGEQWIDGFSRAALNFQYSLDATSLTNGTWTSFSAIDFLAPSTTAQETSTLDRIATTFVGGNTPAFSRQLSGVIGGLAIADGGTFGLRWSQSYISTPHLIGDTLYDVSSNDGLAIDDVVLRGTVAAVPEPASWALMIAGFGLVGGTLRRRSRRRARLNRMPGRQRTALAGQCPAVARVPVRCAHRLLAGWKQSGSST